MQYRRPQFDSWLGKIPWRKDRLPTPIFLGFPGSLDGKESARKAGDLGSIPGLGRSPEGGHGNPRQYSCLENPYGQRILAGYSPWGREESDMTEPLSTAQIRWLSDKEPACLAGDEDLTPEPGGSPEEGIGSPLEYSCLGNPMDRGVLQAIVHAVAKEMDLDIVTT